MPIMAARHLLLALFLTSLPFLSIAFSEDNPTSQKLLVVLDDWSLKASHSIFFKSLTGRGYDLDFRLSTDESITLQKYGVFLYDGLVLFSPAVGSESLPPALDLASLLEFVDSGRNVLLAADVDTSDLIRDLATECGVDLDERKNNLVIDHQNFAGAEINVDNSLIVATEIINATTIVGPHSYTNPIIYRGLGLTISPASSLVIPVLSASKSAYTGNLGKHLVEVPALQGSRVALVAALQGRNNARVLVAGSIDMFSDLYFNMKVEYRGERVKTANLQFAEEISKWTFHERGHLKAGELKHHKKGEEDEPQRYRVGDYLDFSVEILDWSGKEWVPYKADDVQVQFFMMSPYVLKNLSHNDHGVFSTEIHVPDVYGVFQFKVEYKRLGFTTLSLSKQIPVRPFYHDEYERFIPSAFPYYASSFSMMFGFFLVGFIFLYHK